MRFGCVFIAMLGLAGCATGGRDAPVPAASAASAGANGASLDALEFVGPQTELAASTASVVLLGHGEYARNRRVCLELTRSRAPAASAVAVADGVDAIPIRVPMQEDRLDPQGLRDCGYVLGAYDYARAQTWMVRLGVEDRRGPFLVTLFPDRLDGDREPFLLADASDLDAARITDLVADWQRSLQAASAEMEDTAGGSAGPPEALPERDASRFCSLAGDAIRVTGPVLVEVGRQAFLHYPGVSLVYGLVGSTGAGSAAATALRIDRDGAVGAVGGGARTACVQMRSWIQQRILRRDGE